MDRAVFPCPVYRRGTYLSLCCQHSVYRLNIGKSRLNYCPGRILPVVSFLKKLKYLMPESAATSTISITVNGEERNVSPRYPLIDLLQDLDIDPTETSGIAVAINESVIRRTDWDDATLADDDTVEVITAQQGG
jgi:sulfur carrier protein